MINHAAHIASRLVATLRATRAGLGDGVTLGRGVRLGRRVVCHAATGGTVCIGDRVEIGEGTSLSAGPGATLIVGDDVFISGGCIVAAVDSIRIGPGTMFGELVSVRDHDHDPRFPPKDHATLSQPVSIGARVWIGAKASVVRGGSVGDDAVVGAHGLVNRQIDAACLAVGVPARVVRRKIRETKPRSSRANAQHEGHEDL